MSSTTPNATDSDELPVSTESTQWETVGRELLQSRLDFVSEELVRMALRTASSRIGAGKRLRERDIRELREAINRAEQAVELAAKASPESSPNPDLWKYLDDSAKQAYVDDVTQQQ